MKYIIITLLMFVGIVAKGQNPTQAVPTQFSTGWFKQGWPQADSGHILANRLPNFSPRFPGTIILHQDAGIDTTVKFWTGSRWVKLLTTVTPTAVTWGSIGGTLSSQTDLQNALNLKLNISDTTNKWVNNIRRQPGSLNVEMLKNGTWQTAYTDSISAGGSGTVTSITLSMPAAFTVLPSSTITTSGTFNVSGAGTTAQYIRGNGTLATFDTTAIPNFFSKVRGLFSSTSPIVYSNGAISILNANASGQKGAATFNNSHFSDNGAGTISLTDLVTAGSCSGCNLNIDAQGRITGYSTGAGGAIDNTNIGLGFRPVNPGTQEMRTYFGGFGVRIDSVSNTNGLTWSADTTRSTGLPTYWYVDSSVAAGGGGVPLVGAYKYLGNVTPSTAPASDLYYSVYNVKDFDLVDDSATDNTSAFRALLALIPDGATIYFPGGGLGYLFTDSIRIEKNVIIKGDGKGSYQWYTIENVPNKGATNLYFTSATKNFLYFDTSTTNKNPVFTIRDLSIINTSSTEPTDGAGIVASGNTSHQTIDNITVSGFYNNIYLQACHISTISNCNIISPIFNAIVCSNIIEPDGGGIRILDNNIISGPHATSIARGVYLKGAGAVIIAGNFFNAQATLDTATQFVYDIYSDFQDGRTSEINIHDNGFANYKKIGVYIGNVQLPMRVLKITNNYFTPVLGSESEEAIYVENFDNVFISDISAYGPFGTTESEPVVRLNNVENITIGPITRTNYLKDYEATGSSDISTIVKNTDGEISENANFTAINGTFTAGNGTITAENGGFTAKTGMLQIWKDATPSKAAAIGLNVPGDALGNDMVHSIYDGTGWRESFRILSANERVQIKKGIDFPAPSGTNRNISILNNDPFGFDNLAAVSVYPTSGTATSPILAVIPRGTGFASNFKSQITVYNTDVVTDGTNYEFGGFRAAGLAYVFGSGHAGTGTTRPIMLASGYFTDGVTNANQVLLNTDGSISLGDYGSGANTGTVAYNLAVTSTGNLIEVTPTSTTTLYNGNGTLSGGRTVDGDFNSLVFDTLFNFRVNTADGLIHSNAKRTRAYTELVRNAGDSAWWFGYTPQTTPGGFVAFDKGTAFIVDTNNNVGIGNIAPSSSMPLYGSADGGVSINGLMSTAANFYRVRNVTATGNILNTDYFITIDASGGAVTLTLPAASGVFGGSVGIQYIFKRLDNSGNTVEIQRAGSDTIDGGTSFSLTTQWESKGIQCASSSTWLIAN